MDQLIQPPCTIRHAVPADAPAIAQLLVDTWRSTYRGLVNDAFLDSLTADKRSEAWRIIISEQCPPKAVVVAEVQGAGVVGFASAGEERDGIDDFEGEVFALYILKAYQRRGIGRRIVQEAAHYLLAANMPSMLIWVLRGNTAEGFYRAMGGRYHTVRPIVIGGQTLDELAYVWTDIHELAEARTG
jgi:ribosomal protein S18 acetylase RimI-like enzyme